MYFMHQCISCKYELPSLYAARRKVRGDKNYFFASLGLIVGLAETKAMAKKKKSSKDSKQNSIPTEWTGKSVEQLKDLIDELQCDLEKAKKSRNKAQTEFSSIQSYYDVTRENIRELDMRIEKKDLEIENVEQDNEAELKVYEQKSNFVKYCHEQKLKQAKEDTDSRTKESIVDHESQVETTKTITEQLVNDKDATEERLNEEFSNTRQQRIDDLSRIKRQLDADVLSFEQQCFAHQKLHTKELADRRTSELHAIETRKNTHLKDIMTSHERSCKDMKSYFAGVERQQSIDTEELQAQIRRLKKLVVKHESESGDIKESNRIHGDDLKLCSDSVSNLKHQTKDMEKDGISLKAANARLKVTRKAILEARNEYESLQRKVASLKEEINNVKNQTEELNLNGKFNYLFIYIYLFVSHIII